MTHKKVLNAFVFQFSHLLNEGNSSVNLIKLELKLLDAKPISYKVLINEFYFQLAIENVINIRK